MRATCEALIASKHELSKEGFIMNTQQAKRALSASILKGMENESGFITHEWEELVEKLISSSDPQLRAIGLVEGEAIRLKKKGSKATMH